MKLRSKTEASVPDTTAAPTQNTASQLLAVLSQHEMLTTLCANLSSADVVHLGATCKEAKTYVFDSPTIFQQLKGDAICDGRGLIARERIFGHDVREDTCLAGSERPCTDCGAMVCEECRFHLDYSYVPCGNETPGEVEECRWSEQLTAEEILEYGLSDDLENTKLLAGNIEAKKAWGIWNKREKRFCLDCHPLKMTDFIQNRCCGASEYSQTNGGFYEHFVGNRWLCMSCFFLEEKKSFEERRVKVIGLPPFHGHQYYCAYMCDCGQPAHEESTEVCKYCEHAIACYNGFERNTLLPRILGQLGHEKKVGGKLAEIYAQLG